jgi:hypothetical protein
MDVYYASRSKVPLKQVCESLRTRLGLPPFTFDCHDNWRYGTAETAEVRMNVTRAGDFHTIETWMADCPAGVNYQLILTAGAEPEGFSTLLAEILESQVNRYASRG